MLAGLCGFYVARHFEMDSRSENLISERVPWRQSELQFDRAFPQRNNLTLVVIDGATPERAEQAAAALRSALLKHPDLFPVVRDLQGDPFFAKNGLLYLPLQQVRDTTVATYCSAAFPRAPGSRSDSCAE